MWKLSAQVQVDGVCDARAAGNSTQEQFADSPDLNEALRARRADRLLDPPTGRSHSRQQVGRVDADRPVARRQRCWTDVRT